MYGRAPRRAPLDQALRVLRFVPAVELTLLAVMLFLERSLSASCGLAPARGVKHGPGADEPCAVNTCQRGPMTKNATQFTFQATLLATISVEAATQAEAERKLRTALETSDANLGFLDNAPIVVPVAIEGDLDLVDAQEAPRPQHGSRRRPAPANEPR